MIEQGFWGDPFNIRSSTRPIEVNRPVMNEVRAVVEVLRDKGKEMLAKPEFQRKIRGDVITILAIAHINARSPLESPFSVSVSIPSGDDPDTAPSSLVLRDIKLGGIDKPLPITLLPLSETYMGMCQSINGKDRPLGNDYSAGVVLEHLKRLKGEGEVEVELVQVVPSKRPGKKRRVLSSVGSEPIFLGQSIGGKFGERKA